MTRRQSLISVAVKFMPHDFSWECKSQCKQLKETETYAEGAAESGNSPSGPGNVRNTSLNRAKGCRVTVLAPGSTAKNTEAVRRASIANRGTITRMRRRIAKTPMNSHGRSNKVKNDLLD